MELKRLEILRAIAETRSFREAAERLHLTQPAVSHQLKKLEDEIGETLIFRTRPKVTISDAGQEVLAAATRIEQEVEYLKQRFRPSTDDQIKGTLRVTASPLGIVYLYGNLLERFIAEHPNIEVVLTAVETPLDGARQALAGRADAAFVPFPVEMPRLTELELGTTDHVLIVAPDHPLAEYKMVSVRETRQHPFIRYQTGAGSRQVSDSLFEKHGGYGRIFLESNDTEFVKRIVGLGLAVALVPRFTVSKEVASGRLKAVRLDHADLSQRFGLVYRAEIRMRTLRLFCDYCLGHRDLVTV